MNPAILTSLALFLAIPGLNADPAGSAPTEVEQLDQALADKNFAKLDAVLQRLGTGNPSAAVRIVIDTRMKDEEPGVRRLAVYALSELDLDACKRAVPALVEALRDEEPRVRARVCLALGKIGPDAAKSVPRLRDMLKDPDPRVRVGAARAIGLSGGGDINETVHMLVGMLKDMEPSVRSLAADVLAQLGPLAKDAAPTLKLVATGDSSPEVRKQAAAALVALEPSLPMLLEALAAPAPDRRLWAVSLLAKKGPEAKLALPNLIKVLDHDTDPLVRAGAAFALGKMGAEGISAGPPLIHALQDEAARVRTAAAMALAWLGPEVKGVAQALAAALADEDVDVAAAVANALGSLGPAAAPAVPMLVEMQKQDNLVLRRRAVDVLSRLGSAASGASSALVATLNDSDMVLRRGAARALVAVGPQAEAPVPALLEALHYTGTLEDAQVRAWACLSLAEIGASAVEAIPSLLTALQDEERHVRTAASFALGRIGVLAMPGLIKALAHVDAHVRTEAAHALGAIGPQARRALPVLREALRDTDAGVFLAVSASLARIATGLQLAQETEAVADLAATLKALEAAKGTRAALEQELGWTAAMEQVRLALRALEALERASLLNNLFQRPWFPWVVGVAIYTVTLLSLWTALLLVRPLLLFRINEALRAVPCVGVPGLTGTVQISLRNVLLVGFFHYHRRVLDAWIGQHVEQFRQTFQATRTVKDRGVFVPIPVVLDGQVVVGPSARQLGQAINRKRGCLLIWGEGGAGKTTLACQLGRWSLAEDPCDRPCEHAMLPVLIEHELDLKVAEGKPPFTALTEAVRGQLQALIGQPVSEELLGHLLRQRRILVLVDHLSEISPAARAAIRPGHADFPAHALVVTSRSEEVLDGVPKSVVQPLRIQGNRLSSFMEAYLVKCGKRDLFDDAEFFEECRRLSVLTGSREITVLLAKLYAQQMIVRKEGGHGTPPTNLPDLILGYLNELNRAVDKDRRRSDLEVQRDAETLAWECLRQTFRPEPANLDAAVEALGGPDARVRLAYLEEQLKVLRLAEPAQDRVSFTLDPLAEYLAALHLVNKHRLDANFWREFVAQVDSVQAEHETIQGFLNAVRECCRVRQAAPGVLDLIDARLSRAA